MTGFSYHRRSRQVIATFSGFEADLLRSLAAQLVELLRNEAAAPVEHDDPLAALLDFSGPITAPEDPVLLRLLPDAYDGDEEAAGEFRRFTEAGLRDRKVDNASVIMDTLDAAGLNEPSEDVMIDVELGQPEARAWMTALTDVRLALATRLGVEEGDDEVWSSLPEDDPARHVHAIYQWAAFLQETLVEALAAAIKRG